ncbi:MAG: virulence factor SrfB [Verrucomicrobia bacterium]|nr:virulence factor SrfB [Verrucomicrobiota bacterium]
MKFLRLFPNTGHQFFSIDLEELLAARRDSKGAPQPPPPLEQLIQFVTLQQAQNLPPDKRDKFSGWQPWEGLAWLLYQYGIIYDPDRNENRPVLHLAIESNLGDYSRGTILQKETARGGKRAAPHPFLAGREAEAAGAPAGGGEARPLPYVSRDVNDLHHDYPEGSMWLEDPFGGGRVRLPSRMDPRYARDFNFELPPETVKLLWMPSGGDQPVEVDLIVDLGNTRTTALLLEDHGAVAQAGDFGHRTQPVRFLPRGLSFGSRDARENIDDYAVIDSWVLVHRSTFANLEPPASNEKTREFAARFGTDEVRARLMDQRFVALSPVLVGGGRAPTGAAKTLARAVLADDQQSPQFYLSSPKRYAWDDLSIGLVAQHWEQIPNEHDADAGQFKPLGGLIRQFMHPDGEDFDLPVATLQGDDVQPYDNASVPATYPRRDTVCWFALAILEAARRQINAPDLLEGRPRPKVVRRLRNIRVTYPAGWPGEEREAYLGQWRRATRLFSLAHLDNPLPRDQGGEAPALVTEHLDEAVSSQLPILFSELRNLGHNADTWFDLHGAGGDVTVMNIDIGGGTTDIAAIRYSPEEDPAGGSRGGRRVVLRPKLLYRDGHTIAGDLLVKRLIETIVLPGWLSSKGALPFVGNAEARNLIVSLLKTPRQNPVNTIIPGATSRLGRIVRLAFVPLANEILRRLTLAERDGTTAIRPIQVAEIADATAIRELNSLALQLIVRRCQQWGKLKAADLRRLGNPGLFQQWFDTLSNRADGVAEMPFRPDREILATVDLLNGCITSVFGGMISSLADLVAEHECNLVIVSGKPSELSQVRRLVVRELPVPAQRIIQVKDFPAGEWYPSEFLESGRIRDAKTVTVAGAALYQDVLNGNLTGFHLASEAGEKHGAQFNWGVLGATRDARSFSEALLFPAGTPSGRTERRELPLQSWIGRSLRLADEVRPEPVYRLNLTPDAARPGVLPADFNKAEATVRFAINLEIAPDVGERLQLVPGSMELLCRGVRVEVDAAHLVRLRLCTLMDDAFWLDAPAFDVDAEKLFGG